VAQCALPHPVIGTAKRARPHPYLSFTFRSLSLYASLEGLKKALRRTKVSFGFQEILLKSPNLKGISIPYYLLPMGPSCPLLLYQNTLGTFSITIINVLSDMFVRSNASTVLRP